MAATNPNRTPEGTESILDDREARALNSEMAELKAELSRLSELVGEIAGSRYRRAKDKATGIADDLVDRGAALQEEAMARAGLFEEEMQRTVRERPLTAVAVAAGVGYLVGLLSRSHR